MIPNKGILKYRYLSENAEEGMDGLGQAFKMNKVLPKVDMATALKSIGEFSASKGEDVQKWSDTAENICLRCGYEEDDIVLITSLALRGNPKDWANNVLKEEPAISWSFFKDRLVVMFSSQREVSETVSRFFSSPKVQAYESYIQLLQDADQIRYRGVVSDKELMRQLIARAPDSLKSMLIQAGESQGWYQFRRCAESYECASFPDKIVNQIAEIENINSTVHNRNSRVHNRYPKKNR